MKAATRCRSGRRTRAGSARRSPLPARPPIDGRARLERMFDAHHALVWRTLRRRGLDADAAADVTQQTFLVAAERFADINPDSERAFLVGTALRMAMRLGAQDRALAARRGHGHARRRRPRRDGRADRDPAVRPGAVQGRRRAGRDVRAVRAGGLSSPEIAALLEIPLGTVASRLRRARDQFRTVVAASSS